MSNCCSLGYCCLCCHSENTVAICNISFLSVKFLTLYSIDTHFDASTTEIFEDIVGKGEFASNKQFLHFPHCFLLNQKIVSPFVHVFDTISLVAFELEEPKIGISGKGLKLQPIMYKLLAAGNKVFLAKFVPFSTWNFLPTIKRLL